MAVTSFNASQVLSSPAKDPCAFPPYRPPITNAFSYLNLDDLGVSRCINKAWNNWASELSLWKAVLVREIAFRILSPLSKDIQQTARKYNVEKIPEVFKTLSSSSKHLKEITTTYRVEEVIKEFQALSSVPKNLQQITSGYGVAQIIKAWQIPREKITTVPYWAGDGPMPIHSSYILSSHLIENAEKVTEKTLCALLGKESPGFTEEELESLRSHLTYRDLPPIDRQEIRKNLFSRLMPLLTYRGFTCIGFTAGDGNTITFSKASDTLCFECGNVTTRIKGDGSVTSMQSVLWHIMPGKHFLFIENEETYSLHSSTEKYTVYIGEFEKELWVLRCAQRKRDKSPVMDQEIMQITTLKNLLILHLAYMDYVVNKLEDIESELRAGDKKSTNIEQKMVIIAATLLEKLESVTKPQEMLVALNQALTKHTKKDSGEPLYSDETSHSVDLARNEKRAISSDSITMEKVSLEGIHNISLGSQDSLYTISLERTEEETVLIFEKQSAGRFKSSSNRTVRFIKKRNCSTLIVAIGKRKDDYEGYAQSTSAYGIKIHSNHFCVAPYGREDISAYWPLAVVIDNVSSYEDFSVSRSFKQQPSEEQRTDLVYLYRIFNTISDLGKHPNTVILNSDRWGGHASNIYEKEIPKAYLQSLLKKSQGSDAFVHQEFVFAAFS